MTNINNMENQNYYDDILFLINKEKLLEATKYIKNISGIGLKEAKDCVDSLLEVKKQRMLTTEDISNCLRKNYIDLDKIAPKNSASAQWGLRNIKDINNIIPYSTLHLDYNMVFFNFLYNNFCDCEIESFVPVKKLFPHASFFTFSSKSLVPPKTLNSTSSIVSSASISRTFLNAVIDTSIISSVGSLVVIR